MVYFKEKRLHQCNYQTRKFNLVSNENSHTLPFALLLVLLTSDCLTGSWSVWSHIVTPHWHIVQFEFIT